jgi:hypothetical protein
MKITYDHSTPLGMIGPTPWAGIGMDKWFEGFTAIAIHGWGGELSGVPRTVLPDPALMRDRFLLEDAFEVPAFARLIRDSLPPAPLLTWHLDVLPDDLQRAGYRAIPRNPAASKRFENKAWIRRQLSDRVPFPECTIYPLGDITADKTAFDRVAQGRESFVMQHDSNSGARGTFLVHTFDEYVLAAASLQDTTTQDAPVDIVVSQLIGNARERSVQCCVTGQGVFVGPLQKQIIGDPQLVNLSEIERPRFAGGEISPSDPLIGTYPEIRSIVTAVGEFMRTQGYRGILGVDFLVAPDGRVYMLEINPRSTGLTPLLTHMWRDERDLPAYLLHTLENCDIPYTITEDTLGVSGEGSFLQLHSHRDDVWQVSSALKPGTYRWDADRSRVVFASTNARLTDIPDATHFIVETTYPQPFRIRPGRRLMKLYFGRSTLDEHDQLTPESRRIVAAMYDLAQAGSAV